MEFAFGFALFVVGFAMLMAGVGLLLGGEITFKNGKKITKPVGRRAGILLVSFFPLAWLALFLARKIVTDQTMPSAVVTWPMALVCIGVSGLWVLRGMKASKPRRSYTLPASASPLVDAAPVEPLLLEFDVPNEPPPPGPPVGKPERAKPRGKSPFDFT